jgi:hypothetical protein
VARRTRASFSDRTRARGIRIAGVSVILLGAGAALLPADKGISSDVMGALLIAAGLIEVIAGSLRRDVRRYEMTAGAVTAFAGALFVINPETQFFPTVWPIVGWLLVRSAILAYASTHTGGSVRMWTALSAGTDFLLAVLLIAGLSVAALVVSIFGPTPPLIASLSWILAASFVATGLLLLEVASCEQEGVQA